MNKKSVIRAKDENVPLPVAVHASKTSVLKLSRPALNFERVSGNLMTTKKKISESRIEF